MAEKRGHLEKLTYDFPTDAKLEVMIKNKWYRVTSREFRSFDSKRRYSRPERQPGIGQTDIDEIEYITVEYDGPLYMYGTNKAVYKTYNEKMVNSPYFETMMQQSQSNKSYD